MYRERAALLGESSGNMKVAIVLDVECAEDDESSVYVAIDRLLDAGAIQGCIKRAALDNGSDPDSPAFEISDAFCSPFNADLLSEMDE